MENTETLLFGQEDGIAWFICLGKEAWKGPLTSSQLYQGIVNQEWSWGHFVSQEAEEGVWKRLCEQSPFIQWAPSTPSQEVIHQIQVALLEKKQGSPNLPPPLPPALKPQKWYLCQAGVQKGPFSLEEMEAVIRSQPMKETTYAWHEGLPNWKRLRDFSEFASPLSPPITAPVSVPPPPQPLEKRKFPRAPLVAELRLLQGTQVLKGLCRDVSLGGMQVLLPFPEQEPGTLLKLKFNVLPKQEGLKPFVAEAIWVRSLEDGRGFAVRFHRLSDEAKAHLEAYLSHSEETG